MKQLLVMHLEVRKLPSLGLNFSAKLRLLGDTKTACSSLVPMVPKDTFTTENESLTDAVLGRVR